LAEPEEVAFGRQFERRPGIGQDQAAFAVKADRAPVPVDAHLDIAAPADRAIGPDLGVDRFGPQEKAGPIDLGAFGGFHDADRAGPGEEYVGDEIALAHAQSAGNGIYAVETPGFG